jgi:ABC-type nickel/cobalt efflux system permease component RcnA
VITPEILLLCGTAATIAFVHTLLGPDHYLPFAALAKSREWSVGKALRTTLVCGAGHIVGSVVLGFVGIYASIQLGALQWIEGWRGDIAAWALVSFGLVYMAWGLRRAWRDRPHAHWHSHDGHRHCHVHTHAHDHSHVHSGENTDDNHRSVAGWAIFIVFVLGPCEPLIPILMFPAAKESVLGLVAVTTVFAVVTVLTMLLAVAFTVWGLQFVRLPRIENFSDAIAGGTITLCGLSIAVLGL